jgi:hypothetical protein
MTTDTKGTAIVAPQAARVAPAPATRKKGASPKKGAPKRRKSAKGGKAKAAAPKKIKKAGNAQEGAGPRKGTKAAHVVALLQRKNGATLAEIMEKMGWLAHTTRGFMAGAMKKAGYAVESFKSDKGERTYRINR